MQDLVNAVAEMMEEEAKAITQKYLDEGAPPMKIIDAYKEALGVVGKRFEEGIYFVPELILAGEMMRTASEMMKPLMSTEKTSNGKKLGKFLLGTVEGDIHDIGKNIVITLLKGAGFDVIDLGVDVPTEKFVQSVKETGAKVLGLSALLNFTYPVMKEVVDAVNAAGLRDQVRIIVGGTPVNEQVREYAGADYYAKDAVAGVNICKEIYA